MDDDLQHDQSIVADTSADDEATTGGDSESQRPETLADTQKLDESVIRQVLDKL